VISSSQLLAEVERRAVRFFWEQADPATGLINDRANNFGGDSYSVASIASTGYGLAALAIGVERGWLDRTEAVARARTTLQFALAASNQRGWLLHFVDKHTGERVWESEYSSIDTALLMAGASVCGQYFLRSAPEIAYLSDQLYRRIDWWWMLTNGGARQEKQVLSHGWRPESGFIEYDYGAYSEAILLYLLALGAPEKPLPRTVWDAVARPLQSYAGLESLRAGPIFIHQMPFGFFDLRNQRDWLGYDYWVSSTNAMKIHRQFCLDHAAERETYAKGFWGLNASDCPDGYRAYGAPDGPEDGTVSPTGAICSITFNPHLGISAARAFYDQSGDVPWGNYGFVNAFNIDRDWYSPDVIGIDLGMALLAIENYRSRFVWNLMHACPSTNRALAVAGFHFIAEPDPRPVRL
jgi:hypothetical protein